MKLQVHKRISLYQSLIMLPPNHWLPLNHRLPPNHKGMLMFSNHTNVRRKTAKMSFQKYLVDKSFLCRYFIIYLLVSWRTENSNKLCLVAQSQKLLLQNFNVITQNRIFYHPHSVNFLIYNECDSMKISTNIKTQDICKVWLNFLYNSA